MPYTTRQCRAIYPGRREFLIGLAGVTAIARRPQAAAAPAFMYVGSFTGEGRGHGEGLSVFRRAGESARWTLVQLLKELADPSFLIIDRQGRCLYSAHGDGTEATAYQIDQATGRLTVLNRQPTGGRNGVHLAIDATGRCLVLRELRDRQPSRSCRSTRTGRSRRVSDLATLSGTPGPHRTQQESSHPHHCPFDRTGRFVVVPDKGLDKVVRLSVSMPARGKLAAGHPPDVASRAGAAPRHADFHPTQPYVYVINELDSTIGDLPRSTPDAGGLQPLQIVTTLPSSYTGNNTGAEIAGRAVRPLRLRIEPRPRQHRHLRHRPTLPAC